MKQLQLMMPMDLVALRQRQCSLSLELFVSTVFFFPQLNLLFFINITRVLFLKMFSKSSIASSSSGYRYSKWFKSTLVLVPLFGVHHALFLVFYCLTTFSFKIEVIWLYFDIFFTSFQVSSGQTQAILMP